MTGPPASSKAKRLLVFLFHQIIGTWGVIAVAPLLTALGFDLARTIGPAFPIGQLYWLLTGTPFFPVQVTIALILGWLLGWWLHHRSMLWIWVLPALILCLALIAVPTLTPELTPMRLQSGQPRLLHYFGWGCQPENHCIDQIVVTLPFYASIAYSLGALLADRLSAKKAKSLAGA
ncbi:MAG TPA: hypothetical protein VJX29_12510 [Candidatus Acidoferrales bacterium]|nr:hypothetical protein [Candidatus Acidoferrales bacterium]